MVAVLAPQEANSGTVSPLRAQKHPEATGTNKRLAPSGRLPPQPGEKLCSLRAHHGPSAELLNELTQAPAPSGVVAQPPGLTLSADGIRA